MKLPWKTKEPVGGVIDTRKQAMDMLENRVDEIEDRINKIHKSFYKDKSYSTNHITGRFDGETKEFTIAAKHDTGYGEVISGHLSPVMETIILKSVSQEEALALAKFIFDNCKELK